MDDAQLDGLVAVAVRMMDNTIDVSGFPPAGAAARGDGEAPDRGSG